jgi:hypothetical protein
MMHADGGSHKEPGPLPVNPALEKFRAMPGVQVEVEPIPYNQSTDCAHSTGSQQVVEEDTAWERLRGSEEYSAWRVREKQALGVLPRGVVNELDAGSSSGRSSDGPKRLLLRGPGVRGGSRQQQ